MWKHATGVNFGFTNNGVRFKTWGTRMSGDMDTGLGNSLAMLGLIRSVVTISGITKHALSVNGDDSVLIIESKELGKFKAFMHLFKEFGFNMKLDVHYNLNDVEYCQSKILLTDYGYVMSRNPYRVMSRIGWATQLYPKRRFGDYLYALGMCEKASSWGVPVNYAAGKGVYDASFKSKGQRKLKSMSRKLRKSLERTRYWRTNMEPTISMDVRQRFENLWGLSVEMQLDLENITYGQVQEIPGSVYDKYLYKL